MKRFTIALILIFFSTFVFSQNDSIKSQIINRDSSKPIMISNVRKQLLYRFNKEDYNAVKELKNDLTEIEDDEYFALYPEEYWLILYWTKEYNELSEHIQNIDPSYIDSYKTRIAPSNDELQIWLKEKSYTHQTQLRIQLQNAGLDTETTDMLIMHLDWLLLDNNSTVNTHNILSKQANQFLKTYPSSKFNYFIKDHIKHTLTPMNWRYTLEFFSGYGAYTGQLSNNFTNSIPFGIAFNITYKDFELYLRDYVGFLKSKKNFEYSLGTYEKGSGMITVLGEASLGYTVYNNDKFKISPSAGIGIIGIEASTFKTMQTPELEEISIGTNATYVLGLNFDIKLESFYLLPHLYNSIKIKYGYCMPSFEKEHDGMTGNMHYITVGYGLTIKGLKKNYLNVR